MQCNAISSLEQVYADIESSVAGTVKKPCIGLSVNLRDNLNCVADAYIKSVTRAGGIAVLIPALEDTNEIVELLDKVDGIILTGGGDVDPSFFCEEPKASPASINMTRDLYDLKLIKLATDRRIPVFGICRGMQILNVAFGGSLYQDIPSLYPLPCIEHDQEEPRNQATQKLEITEGSWLYSVLGKNEVKVNTFHHQAIKDVAPAFRVCAQAADGIIEALEPAAFQPVWGVQFHPESMASEGDEDMLRLFVFFVNEADLFRRAKRVHDNILSVDSHCDTPMFFDQNADIGKRSNRIRIEYDGNVFYESIRTNIPKMQEGRLDAVFMAAYLPQGKRDTESTRLAFEKTTRILKQTLLQIERNKEHAGLALNTSDIARLKKENKKAILLGVENAYGVGNDIRNLSLLKELGVGYITLCHNGHNDVCDSASEDPEHNGLSHLGKEMVKEMNRLGIMVDISHTSEKTSYDAIALSRHPVIASHSSAKALCEHRRNLSDDLMKALASKGGVVQVCLYDSFLSKSSDVAITHAVEHIEHIVQTIGIDYVGIGSDFDGGGGITGLNAANEMIGLTVELLRKGYSEADIRKIWGGNLMRVMDCVQKK